MRIVRRRPDLGYLDANLWCPKSRVNVEAIQSALTIELPSRSQGAAPDYIRMCLEAPHHLIVPRRFFSLDEPYPFPVVDCRPKEYERVRMTSRLVLDAQRPERNVQHEAFAALQRNEGGILQLSCGTGKTVIALHYAAYLSVPTLVIVDTSELMRQWREEAEEFLVIDGGIGLVAEGVMDWRHPLVIASYQTLSQKSDVLPEEFRRYFGLSISDEQHHADAPVFARTCDLIYGIRVGLTATPNRRDGLHVIGRYHFGPIMYKNLERDLEPSLHFVWTGTNVDLDDPAVAQQVNSSTGEVHMGLLAAYLGSREDRIQFILNQVRTLVAEGRKVLVLSVAIGPLVNLLAAWNGMPDRYTAIPIPTLADVGYPEFDQVPVKLSAERLATLKSKIEKTAELLGWSERRGRDTEAQVRRTALLGYEKDLLGDTISRKIASLLDKRRAELIARVISAPSDAGLMISRVGPEERERAIKQKNVTFAIARYGKEGLNSKALDTVMAIEPMTDPNSIQQFMGRPSRLHEGKKHPKVFFLEDNVHLLIGMCTKLRRVLSEWPVDEGGPIRYTQQGYPWAARPPRRFGR